MVQAWWGPTFPLGTLLVNVSGCLGIGFLVSAFAGPWPIREELRLAILVGGFGGYTTFSALGRETWVLFQQGEWVRAGLYMALTNVLGLLAVAAGELLAAKLRGDH
jgi:CrcB protein